MTITESIEIVIKEVDNIINTYGKYLSVKQYEKLLYVKKIINSVFD